MAARMRPFLMFEGRAEEAMNLYVSMFPGAEVGEVVRYGPGEPGPEGTIKTAEFTLAGQRVMCSDSFVKHGFTFTPSISFFVDFTSEDELRRVAAALGEGGREYMPPGNYGFSRLFTWVGDRFGVTWQLNVP